MQAVGGAVSSKVSRRSRSRASLAWALAFGVACTASSSSSSSLSLTYALENSAIVVMGGLSTMAFLAMFCPVEFTEPLIGTFFAVTTVLHAPLYARNAQTLWSAQPSWAEAEPRVRACKIVHWLLLLEFFVSIQVLLLYSYAQHRISWRYFRTIATFDAACFAVGLGLLRVLGEQHCALANPGGAVIGRPLASLLIACAFTPEARARIARFGARIGFTRVPIYLRHSDIRAVTGFRPTASGNSEDSAPHYRADSHADCTSEASDTISKESVSHYTTKLSDGQHPRIHYETLEGNVELR